MSAGDWEVVIGLEVHVHLRTESKLFSPAPVRYGDPPNRDVHAIDLGLPGVLPVLNERAVELAIRFGLATHCSVNPRSVFARKNYFYPDLPKGYQISQYEEPIVHSGWIEIEVPAADGETPRSKRVGITRAHLEEDAGKSIHDDPAGGGRTLLDFNRCGAPLLEIVSEPDLRSAAEAGSYLRSLRSILRYTEVSEADLEKGQFRCDANVSLRPRGASELGVRTELKNINSFRFVEAAIETEVLRQAEILEGGGRIVQSTLGYDPERRRVLVQRVKENASDYRYFPDPDLVPVAIEEAQVERVRAALPELPDQRRARFQAQYGLSDYDARLLTESRALADFFEEAAEAHGAAKTVANWVLRDLLQALKEGGREIDAVPLRPGTLAGLIGLVDAGRLTARSARDLLPEIVSSDADPEELVRERGLEAVRDEGLLERSVDEVLAANPGIAEQFRAGDAKVLNFLMGQVMKQTRGKADPARVRELLAAKLSP